jgi:hypothetical protein
VRRIYQDGGEPVGRALRENRTLLTYEARARASDTATRRRLFLFNTLMAPLQSYGIRRTLDYVKGLAERQCAAPAAYRQSP